jgi:predicted translin family RNA/ssDNA-binding protein
MTDFGRQLQGRLTEILGPIQQQLSTSDDLRDAIFRETKTVFRNNAQIFFMVRTGDMTNLDQLIQENQSVVSQILVSVKQDETQREGRLSQAIEKFTEARLLQNFFLTGKLVSPSEAQPCNDDEYLGGVIGCAQELARYVIGKASEGDFASISICRTLVTELNGKMLEFDFRNGPLRKKYDGLKYALKTIEDVMFELSMVDDNFIDGADTMNVDDGECPAKRAKLEAAVDLLDVAAIDAIRQRMEAYDKLREEVIKQSRDVQKLSKQAIFAVHRGNLKDCRIKLDQAMAIAVKILVIVNEHPTLRQGAFGNSLEEWAEGAMTLEWAEKQVVMSMEDMKVVNYHEYIGALSDFSGEIGRMAVASAAKRDVESVRRVLQVDVAIAGALMLVNTSGRYTQKTNAVLMNLKKVEDIVYDLSMLQRGGRIGRARDVEPKDEGGGKDADNEA